MIRKSYLAAVTALAMLIPAASVQAQAGADGWASPQLDTPSRGSVGFGYRETLPANLPLPFLASYTLGFRLSYTTYNRYRRCVNVRSRSGPQCFWVWRGQRFHDALGRVRATATALSYPSGVVTGQRSVGFTLPVPPGSFVGAIRIWEITIISGVTGANISLDHVRSVGCSSDNWNSYADSGAPQPYWECRTGDSTSPPSKVPVG